MHPAVRIEQVGKGRSRMMMATVDMARVGSGRALHIVYPVDDVVRAVCGVKGELQPTIAGCDPRAVLVERASVCVNCRTLIGPTPAPTLANEQEGTMSTIVPKPKNGNETKNGNGETKPNAEKKQPDVDVQALADVLFAVVTEHMTVDRVAPHDKVRYEKLVDEKRTVAYVSHQRRGLRVDMPLPKGEFDVQKVANEKQARHVAELIVKHAAAVKEAKVAKKAEAEKAEAETSA